ncbi:RNA polymerase sigma factor (sigma-70 family) [Clostridium acetobutylicum]|nr:sigma-70 family RNA polymerase sigma factor [Clostridium acetobutylicum]NOV90050.1 RNA polymerase sigma factor (sigma-70 family) [Clostridium acetobutylicum]NOW15423.1 RNA polymerase sigma factor (sigma-70 family) [Clostridium acetobutylicum]
MSKTEMINLNINERNKVVEKYMTLVKSIARKYINRSGTLELEDMVQSGAISMINAVENFDYNKGVKFSTYARHCVEGGMKNYCKKNELIHLSEYQRKDLRRIKKLFDEKQLENKDIDITEISAELGIEKEKAINLICFLNKDKYIPIDDYEYKYGKSFEKEIVDNILIRSLIENLPKNQQNLIRERLKDMSFTDIGKKYNITRQAVQQSVKRIINKMKRELEYA